MRVLILGDGQGWIIDRVVERMVEGIPCEFTVDYYTRISSEKLLEHSRTHDLVHYGNWDVRFHFDVLDKLECPWILSVHSHRYYPMVKEAAGMATKVHVVNRMLLDEFPGAVYIPVGIDPRFKPDHEFTVGWAGHPEEYKGYHLIERACEELGVRFKPACGDLPPEEMPDYYRSIDLYVCASVAEGFSTPVMECMAMNVPVITTDVGVPSELNVIKVERSVEGIKQGILKFYTSAQVLPEYSWENVNRRFYELYREVVGL